jgi:hypothetical protein
MVMEFRFGLMGLDMKENGRIIEQREREDFYMLVVIVMKVSGKRIELMVKEYIIIQMEESMMAIG